MATRFKGERSVIVERYHKHRCISLGVFQEDTGVHVPDGFINFELDFECHFRIELNRRYRSRLSAVSTFMLFILTSESLFEVVL